ncbi:beta-aspartyl-peptidase [Halosimplex carlsbadense 2-9-1]|uniref:Plant-type L-asparaginase n=1 Tax=Halosimplex carlsbadense 2-9-1 TaxID=797114 RepID=M0CY47_9EURY|nr:isoaspartyl peptidase/L-asparaginase [Halosimplex carlsbadense]ELZ28140.1 beta-aspartyl-peptidase [Halosimplex carlsbadense 2-9-1]
MQLLAHGGAGSPPEEPAERQAVLDEAVARGAEESDPVAAVCATVRVLEVDPSFNAGVGSAVQSDGMIRTDAGVMTADGEVGAAGAMPEVCHAVEVARAVMTETPHVMLAGERAVAFAHAVGVETGLDLWADRTRERWGDREPPTGDPEAHLQWVREHFASDENESGDAEGDEAGGQPPRADPHDHDTVGAVAREGEEIAAATSTGGRWFALAGRVGDVPQVGAGFYASEAGAASATGAGEDIAREGLARRAVGLLERGADAEAAARLAIEEFDDAAQGDAGIVVVDDDGGTGEAYNSPAMQTARADGT